MFYPMNQKRTILLAEDDADVRKMFRIALMVAGFDVREAADGYEALRMLEQGKTDLIVLDLRMPRINGFTVLADIRVLNRNLPVLVVTGVPGDFSHLDVDCVLKKPVPPDQLVATVNECLAKHA
jgi:DNA-binding response OmpR family regulator